MQFAYKALIFSGAVALSASGASASSVFASEAYYTFGANVSSNTTRLLADKAPAIGFPDLPTISFLLFDPADLPTQTLASQNLKATLKLQHDPAALAGTLIPAEDARPVSVSAYGLGGSWNPVDGNIADIEYGVDGADAIATTVIGDPGIYSWDVSALVDAWITGAQGLSALALSGVFGNVNIDDRNSYATMYSVDAVDGLSPHLDIAPIPLPASLWLMLAGLPLLSRHVRRRVLPT